MTRTQYLSALTKARDLTMKNLAQSPRYGVFIHAAEQLELIQALLAANRPITAADAAKVNIGLMAAKELEQSDPEYADLLEQLDYFLTKV